MFIGLPEAGQKEYLEHLEAKAHLYGKLHTGDYYDSPGVFEQIYREHLGFVRFCCSGHDADYFSHSLKTVSRESLGMYPELLRTVDEEFVKEICKKIIESRKE